MSQEKSSLIARAAEDHVRSVLHSMNCSVTPPETDRGVDFLVHMYEGPKVKGFLCEFGVQVKGTESSPVNGSNLQRRVNSGHVVRWISGQTPVLLVICHVTAGSVVTSCFTWVDDYVYNNLRWPLRSNPEPKFKTLSFELPLGRPLVAECKSALYDYARNWKCPLESAQNIESYHENTASAAQSGVVRSKFMNWDVFALPIKYRNLRSASSGSICDLLERAGSRVLLLGAPASGKTITVKRLLAQPPDGMLPVQINEFLPGPPGTVRQGISKKIEILSERHFDYMCASTRLLLMFDGLNEFRHFQRIADDLTLLAEELGNCTVVATCRTGDYRRLHGSQHLGTFEPWEIMDFDADARNTFLSKQPPATQKAVHELFVGHPQLRHECRNQFLFLLLVRVSQKLGRNSVGRADLYKLFLSEYLKFAELGKYERIVIVSLLARLAFRMRTGRDDRAGMDDADFSQWLREAVGPAEAKSMEALLCSSGLIDQMNGRSRFFQETIQEYLCAHYLVEQRILPADFSSEADSVYYDGMEINDVIGSFYLELSGFGRFSHTANFLAERS